MKRKQKEAPNSTPPEVSLATPSTSKQVESRKKSLTRRRPRAQTATSTVPAITLTAALPSTANDAPPQPSVTAQETELPAEVEPEAMPTQTTESVPITTVTARKPRPKPRPRHVGRAEITGDDQSMVEPNANTEMVVQGQITSEAPSETRTLRKTSKRPIETEKVTPKRRRTGNELPTISEIEQVTNDEGENLTPEDPSTQDTADPAQKTPGDSGGGEQQEAISEDQHNSSLVIHPLEDVEVEEGVTEMQTRVAKGKKRRSACSIWGTVPARISARLASKSSHTTEPSKK